MADQTEALDMVEFRTVKVAEAEATLDAMRAQQTTAMGAALDAGCSAEAVGRAAGMTGAGVKVRLRAAGVHA